MADSSQQQVSKDEATQEQPPTNELNNEGPRVLRLDAEGTGGYCEPPFSLAQSPKPTCTSPNTRMMPPPSPNTTQLLADMLKLNPTADNAMFPQQCVVPAAGHGNNSASSDLPTSGTTEQAVCENAPTDQAMRGSTQTAPQPSIPDQQVAAQETGYEFEQVFRDIADRNGKMMQKWAEIFGESETFELMCPVRLDALLAEAGAVERELTAQKEAIVGRLQQLHKTLQQSWEP